MENSGLLVPIHMQTTRRPCVLHCQLVVCWLLWIIVWLPQIPQIPTVTVALLPFDLRVIMQVKRRLAVSACLTTWQWLRDMPRKSMAWTISPSLTGMCTMETAQTTFLPKTNLFSSVVYIDTMTISFLELVSWKMWERTKQEDSTSIFRWRKALVIWIWSMSWSIWSAPWWTTSNRMPSSSLPALMQLVTYTRIVVELYHEFVRGIWDLKRSLHQTLSKVVRFFHFSTVPKVRGDRLGECKVSPEGFGWWEPKYKGDFKSLCMLLYFHWRQGSTNAKNLVWIGIDLAVNHEMQTKT